MRDEDIKVGDVLRIRDWDDMVAEFGTEPFCDLLTGIMTTRIKTPAFRFCKNMKYMCGSIFTIREIISINKDRALYHSSEEIERVYATQNDISVWTITAEMLEPYPNDEDEVFDPLPIESLAQFL